MKFKRLLSLAIAAIIISALIFYLTSGVIKYTFMGMVSEIAIVAIPLFVVFLIIYAIAKKTVKTAAAVRKKSLPNQEGPKP